MKQKFVGRVIALALSLVLALAVFAPVVVSANDNVLYQLATDDAIQSLDVGTQGQGGDNFVAQSNFIHSAGGPTYTIIAHPNGGRAIQVANRLQNHYAIDVHFTKDGFNLTPNGTYTIRVRATMTDGVGFWIGDTDAPWRAPLAQATHLGEGMFEAVWTFTPETDIGERRGVRITANTDAIELTVYEIVVARGTSIPANLPAWTPGQPAPVEEPPVVEEPPAVEEPPLPPVVEEPPVVEPTPAGGSRLQFTLGSTAVLLDGAPFYTLDAAPFLTGGRTMVPVRFIVETLGGEIVTDFTNRDNRMIFIYSSEGVRISTLVIDQELPGGLGAPVMEGGRTFVPLRFVSEVLGAEVDNDFSDSANRLVFVYMP